jgi:peptidoglycan/xylan/chitin deacetylase (PgdA/CDA1 family)
MKTIAPELPLWKSLLLHGYYCASLPVRWWQRAAAIAGRRAPIVVLFYHRIADDLATSWTMSNRSFERQIRWMAERFDLISLEEAQRRIRSGQNARPAVSITFDDGYAENCHRAIPLLVKARIPCTYFVTLRNVVEQEPFPHDRELGYRFMPNNLEQLRAMAGAGIEIGAHTYSHPDLAQIRDESRLRREIVTAARELEQLLDRPVRYFAFPYGQRGNLSVRAFHLAESAGFDAVCSAYGGYNFPGGDAYHLQRIHADEGMIRLKNRITLDPRKLETPRFEWQPDPRAVVHGTV